MARPSKVITTVKQVLGADVFGEKGIVVRFLGKDGAEHHIQIPADEAHGLADMVAIAITRLPVPGHRRV